MTLLVPAVAEAAILRQNSEGTYGYRAEDGEVNRVTISRPASSFFVFSDHGATIDISAAPDCIQDDVHSARCAADHDIVVHLGDRGDEALVRDLSTFASVRLWGNRGHDTVTGSPHMDEIFGGPGNDVLVGRDGADSIFGEGGGIICPGRGGADVLIGGGRRDLLAGCKGDDDIRGGALSDDLGGGAGNDNLRGGTGDDWLDARDGMRDIVAGGAGTDRARFDSVDVVTSIERTF